MRALLVAAGRDLVPAVGDAEALPPLPALPPAGARVLAGVKLGSIHMTSAKFSDLLTPSPLVRIWN